MSEHTEGAGDRSFLQVPRKRAERPLSSAEAIEILQSALHYCQRACLPLSLTVDGDEVVIRVGGATVAIGDDGQARLRAS